MGCDDLLGVQIIGSHLLFGLHTELALVSSDLLYTHLVRISIIVIIIINYWAC